MEISGGWNRHQHAGTIRWKGGSDLKGMRPGTTSSTAAIDAAPPSGRRDLFDGPTEMHARCREFDWSATQLGPLEVWPVSLRTTVAAVLAARHPMLLFWGPENIQLYNDAYIPTFGERRHPEALGMKASECWKGEIWETVVRPQIAEVAAGGMATWYEDQHIPLPREGRVEETYWTYSYSPVFEDVGRIGGALVIAQETTARVFAERRQQALMKQLSVERARLAAVFEQAPALIAVLRGSEHRFEQANHEYRKLVGHRELIGRTVSEALPEVVGQGFVALLDGVLATGEPYVGREIPTVLVSAPDAEPEERFLNFVYQPLTEADGSRSGIFVHGIDVTDSVRARHAVEAAAAELAEGKARYRTLAEAVPVQVWTARADGRLDFVSDQTAAYFGVAADELLGSGWSNFVHPDDLPASDARWSRAMTTGMPYQTEFRLKEGSTGEYRWHLSRAVPEFDDEGSLTGWVGSNTDVEDERRARAEAEAARGVAEAASRAKSDFLTVMSHELRTPLNAIGGYAELLEMGIRGPVTESQREDLARIQGSQRHLLGLINEVLNYARLETGTVRYDLRDVNVSDVLAEAEALVRPQARVRGLTLQMPAVAPTATVRADMEKLRQILVNLLSNAVKFTDRGGVIAIDVHERELTVSIAVRDTGIGIAADKLATIFEPFVQVRADLTRTAEGTGLGLAISFDLARGMEGELTVESTPGEGSVFTVTLPRGEE